MKKFKYDTYMEKARAVIFNSENKLYVCNLNDSLILPGGGIKPEELPKEALKRELKEELGVTNFDIQELVTIDYKHVNFPKYKSEGFENRLNRVHYFLVTLNNQIDLTNNSFTNYELQHNIKIELYLLEELLEKANDFSDNKWKKFTDRELITIIEYITQNNY